MKIVNLTQNTPEWSKYRQDFRNASDAPAMMGVSKYKSRDKLIADLVDGVKKPAKKLQALFDLGHETEALARPVAELILGCSLQPYVVNDGGYISASLDGSVEDFSVIWEHKMLNDRIRRCKELDIDYRVQMEQQLYVTGAKKCLFLATKWDGIEIVDSRAMFYYPDMVLRERILEGWKIFNKDLAGLVF
jgi:putative phage-type endonuclease